MANLLESPITTLGIENLDLEKVEESIYEINYLIDNEREYAELLNLQTIRIQLLDRLVLLKNIELFKKAS